MNNNKATCEDCNSDENVRECFYQGRELCETCRFEIAAEHGYDPERPQGNEHDYELPETQEEFERENARARARMARARGRVPFRR